MESIVLNQTKVFKSKKDLKAEKLEQIDVLNKLIEIADLIDTTNTLFDYVTDPELIEGLIFELNSLHKKYSFYIKICKDRGIDSSGFNKNEKGLYYL